MADESREDKLDRILNFQKTNAKKIEAITTAMVGDITKPDTPGLLQRQCDVEKTTSILCDDIKGLKEAIEAADEKEDARLDAVEKDVIKINKDISWSKKIATSVWAITSAALIALFGPKGGG